MCTETTQETLDHIKQLALTYQSNGNHADDFKKYSDAIKDELLRIAKEIVGDNNNMVHILVDMDGVSFYFDIEWAINQGYELAGIQVRVASRKIGYWGPEFDFHISDDQHLNGYSFSSIADSIIESIEDSR